MQALSVSLCQPAFAKVEVGDVGQPLRFDPDPLAPVQLQACANQPGRNGVTIPGTFMQRRAPRIKIEDALTMLAERMA